MSSLCVRKDRELPPSLERDLMLLALLPGVTSFLFAVFVFVLLLWI